MERKLDGRKGADFLFGTMTTMAFRFTELSVRVFWFRRRTPGFKIKIVSLQPT